MSRDWANWFVISRVRYIENLVITNLLENNQSVRYIEREIKQIRFYDSARVILYMCAVVTEKLLSYFKVKEFSSLLVCFVFIFSRVMTFIRYIGVEILRLGSSIVFVISRISLYRGSLCRGSVPYISDCNFGRAEEYRSLYRGLRYIEVRLIEVPL